MLVHSKVLMRAPEKAIRALLEICKRKGLKTESQARPSPIQISFLLLLIATQSAIYIPTLVLHAVPAVIVVG